MSLYSPISRPGHERSAIAFHTPLGTSLRPREDLSWLDNTWRESFATGSATVHEAASTPPRAGAGIDRSRHKSSRVSHRQLLSDALQEVDQSVQEPALANGVFRVVIAPSAPKSNTKPTVAPPLPYLGVDIPHYRLGTPGFTGQGSAILQSSINTGSTSNEDLTSSVFSMQDYERQFPASPGVFEPLPRGQGAPNQIYLTDDEELASHTLNRGSETLPAQPDLNIANEDNPSLIRMSLITGQLIAATPARLIAQITSPRLLDYELLSDFFLTYRTFINPKTLMTQLIARLGWAVNRLDDFGRIVRVRTFVALRHWILNYFDHDFISDLELRIHFCSMVNKLTRELQNRDDSNGDIKIIRELKKCWSRTLALFWDMPRSAIIGVTDEDVLPGGLAGSRSLLNEEEHRRADALECEGNANIADEQRSDLHEGQLSHEEADPVSIEDSLTSIPLISSRASLVNERPNARRSMLDSAHRVLPQTTPAQVPAKRNPLHNRSGSFSDALRDDRMPLPTPKNIDYDAVLAAVSNVPGSLMRGALLPPASPFLDIILASTPLVEDVRFDFEAKDQDRTARDYNSASSTSDRTVTQSHDGVKRLFGTVRRVLSTKQSLGAVEVSSKSPAARHGSRRPFSAGPYVRHGESKIAVPNLTIVESSEPRVDLLAAGVLENYKIVVSEEMRQQDLRALESNLDSSPHEASDPDDDNAVSVDSTREDLNSLKDEEGLPTEDDHNTDCYQGFRETENMHEHVDRMSDDKLTVAGQVEMTQHNMPSTLDFQHFVHNETESAVPDSAVDVTPEQPINVSSCSDDLAGDRCLEVRQGPYVRGENDVQCVENSHKVYDVAHGASKEEINVPVEEGDTTGLLSNTISSPDDPFSLDCTPLRQLKRQPGGDFQGGSIVEDQDGYQADSSTENLQQQNQTLWFMPSTRTRSSESLVRADNEGRTISLMSTHSSQPVTRDPSYDKHVQQLALLPDIEDGSIESALLRLEGRYDQQSAGASQITRAPNKREGNHVRDSAETEQVSQVFSDSDRAVSSSQTDAREHPHKVLHEQMRHRAHEEETYPHGPKPHLEPDALNESTGVQNPRISAATSLGSYASTPLLERTSSFHHMKRRISKSDRVQDHSLAGEVGIPADEKPVVSPSADPLVDMTRISSSVRNENVLCGMHHTLLDSSSISVVHDDGLSSTENLASQPTTIKMERDAVNTGRLKMLDDESSIGDSEVLPHPLRHPTTPPTRKNAVPQPITTKIPATPHALASRHSRHIPLQSRVDQQIIAAKKNNVEAAKARQQNPGLRCAYTPWNNLPIASHIPFIMGYDSLIVAQQMTLCEKDALSEIDWRELIEIRWTQTSPAVYDWVELLKLYDKPCHHSIRGGVDICTARFNIMVKWTMSEVVLTENIKERAACIVKYIHIAQHARQLRNWATMYQITTALVNSDCSRLKKTWARVPQKDQETLKSLEALIMPMRNFHNLRMEIEQTFTDVPDSDVGCIPFIGIYTHDLVYNAQKPVYFPNPDGGPDAEPLVNFERLHTAAAIVKNLLKLLEASSNYTFRPIPEVLSRCLWLATLPDEEISRRSDLLEA